MHNLVVTLMVLSALALIVLMAVQTDKAEQGGVMGLGGQGARGTGEIDMLVGPERLLKPLTKWVGVGFLFLSVLSAVEGGPSVPQFIGVLAVYLVAMLYGDRIWAALTGAKR